MLPSVIGSGVGKLAGAVGGWDGLTVVRVAGEAVGRMTGAVGDGTTVDVGTTEGEGTSVGTVDAGAGLGGVDEQSAKINAATPKARADLTLARTGISCSKTPTECVVLRAHQECRACRPRSNQPGSSP